MLPALCMLTAGCASTFSARVSTFHSFPAEAARTYAFAPTPLQRDSLEYRAYADRMRAALAGAGFREAADPSYRVSFDWSTAEAVRTVVRAAPVLAPSFSLGIGVGGWRGGYGAFGFGYPFGWPYWGPGYVNVEQAERVVEHRLRMEIDGARAPGTGRVFEGSATAEAAVADMPAVLPLLAQALLRDFPGPSGRSRVVRIELPPR